MGSREKYKEIAGKYVPGLAGGIIGVTGGASVGNMAGRSVGHIRNAFDKDLRDSKKRLRAADARLRIAKRRARRNYDERTGNELKSAQDNFNRTKSEESENLKRAASRVKKYGVRGAVAGAGLGVAPGVAAGNLTGKFIHAFNNKLNTLNSEQ